MGNRVNLFLESSSSFLFSGVVKPKSFNEVNDTIIDSNWFISFLARSWDGVSYYFESFSCGVKAGGSFDFVLAVKTCCCSGSFEEVEVPSFGLVVSGVDVEEIELIHHTSFIAESCYDFAIYTFRLVESDKSYHTNQSV